MAPPAYGSSTAAIHGGRGLAGPAPRGLSTPLFQSTAFEAGGGSPDAWAYTRLGNPTVAAVASRLACLEGTEEALLLASGMAAISSTLLALVPPGGTVVASRELYGETTALLTDDLARLGIRSVFVAVDDHDGWRRELARGADVLYVETISNPLLRVADLGALAALARAAGAVAVVDSTLASPVNVRPVEHGFDVVLHSATKYLNGHSDVVAGAVAGAGALLAPIARRAERLGGCLDPHAAFLLERGLKTLSLRMERHNASAALLARHLEAHPEVEAASHPLLPSHPDYLLAQRLLAGGSGVVSARVRGGNERAERLLGSLRLIRSAQTLGGAETLVSLPHRAGAGVLPGTLRLAVGLEDVEDLVCDLEQALALTSSPHPRRTGRPAPVAADARIGP